jgi:hypothetical protein
MQRTKVGIVRSYLASLVLLLSALAHAEEPISIVISNDSVAVAGVSYKSPAEAMEALKKLHPKEVRFVPAPGVNYDVVRATLEAYQKSGIEAFTGFIGNAEE